MDGAKAPNCDRIRRGERDNQGDQLCKGCEFTASTSSECRCVFQLSGHPAIVRYITAAQHKAQGRAEFSLLTELCSGGPLIDVMQRQRLAPEHVIKIFYALCSAVHHMHDRNPPITHRDIKVWLF